MTDDVTVSFGIDSKNAKTGADQAVRSLDDIKRKSQEAAKGIDQTEKSMNGLTSATNSLKGALVSLGAAFSAQKFLQAASEMESLQAKLVAVSKSAAAGGEAFSYLSKLSQKQSVDINVLGDAYARLLPSVNSGILSMQQLRKILPLVNDNIKAFGLSTGQAQALLLGLSQTLGSGTVTLEDLRQVTDQLPGSFNSLAAAFGKTVGGFKELISKGKLTTTEIIHPLTKALQENEGAAEKMAGTYASASLRLGNSFKFAADEISKATNALGALASVLDFVGDNIINITKAVGALSIVYGARFVAGIIQAQKAQIQLNTAVIAGNAVLIDGVKAAAQRAIFSKNAADADVVSVRKKPQLLSKYYYKTH